MRQQTRRPFRFATPFLAACLLGAAATPAATAAPQCAKADRSPSALGAKGVARTTHCLLNRERAAHGLRPLRGNRKLARAARRHSRDMVAHRYFAHDSRSGARFSARIARTGWMHGRIRWIVGENIAWGSESRATPRQIVASWMNSAPHRANILSAGFHAIGIGVALGTPTGGGDGGATYTTDFGS
jgi:uncharacterized protein YkwD